MGVRVPRLPLFEDSMSLIKIKKKPVAPVRKRNYSWHKYNISSASTVQDIIDWTKELGVTPDKASFATDNDDYYADYYIEAYLPEPEHEFNKRIKIYRQALAVYDKWYDENRQLIDEELAARAAEKKRKADKKKQSKQEILKLQLQKRKIQKQLRALLK